MFLIPRFCFDSLSLRLATQVVVLSVWSKQALLEKTIEIGWRSRNIHHGLFWAEGRVGSARRDFASHKS